MYGFYYFSVLSSFKNVADNGKEENTKEKFLIEASNHADAYYIVSELLNETTSFPETIDIGKVDRLDKVKNLMYSNVLEVNQPSKEGYIEYCIDKEKGISLFSVKVLFEETDGEKTKTTSELYYLPASQPEEAIKHIRAYLKDSVFETKISDVKRTYIDTVLVLKETHRNLVKDYDLLKNRL